MHTVLPFKAYAMKLQIRVISWQEYCLLPRKCVHLDLIEQGALYELYIFKVFLTWDYSYGLKSNTWLTILLNWGSCLRNHIR